MSLITKRKPQNRGNNKVKKAVMEIILFDSEDVITASRGLVEEWEYEP